jgi:hypothetical protein
MRNIIAAAAVLAHCGVATAQAIKGYIGGGVTLTTLGLASPDPNPHLLVQGGPGTEFGIDATLGIHVLSVLDIAAEISLPARSEVVEIYSYAFNPPSRQIDDRYRDVMVSGLFHLHPNRGAVRPEFVIGISYVREDSLQQIAPGVGPQTNTATMFAPYGPFIQIVHDTVGFTLGADVPIRLHQRVSIVPDFRVHWIARPDVEAGIAEFLSLASSVVRGGVGIRVAF